VLEKISERKSSFLREEHGREVMGEAVRRDLAERLRSAKAVRASDAQEYHRNLAAIEAQLEEERARRAGAEADLANQQTGRQAMENTLDGDFPRIPFF
jgi:ABC-type phosphate transport system auxiliary subunit